MAPHRSTSLMTCATLTTFQADDDYDQQALSSWRYPELGWLLSVTEPSALLDRGCGTVHRAMSLSVRLSLFFVKNSNISFLVCLSLNIHRLFLLRGP